MAAREWDLTVDEARGVVAGRCSFSTYDKIIKRPGGFLVGLHVLEAVTGQSVAHFFQEQLQHAAEANRHAMEQARLARSAYGRLAMASDRSGDDGDGPAPTREAGRGARTVGAQKAGGVAR
jgi:CubicO group peptidase (beta-lactamase class C family)